MAVQGSFRAGKNSRIQVNGTNLRQTEWDATVQGDDLDTTNFECEPNAGGDQGIIGVTSFQYNCRGDWDASRNAYDSPPGLYPRSDLSTLKLYQNVTDNVFHLLTVARVLSCRNGAQVRGKVTFEWSGKSNGGYTLATGSV